MKLTATRTWVDRNLSDTTSLSVDMELTEPLTAEELGEFVIALNRAIDDPNAKPDEPKVNVYVDGVHQATLAETDTQVLNEAVRFLKAQNAAHEDSIKAHAKYAAEREKQLQELIERAGIAETRVQELKTERDEERAYRANSDERAHNAETEKLNDLSSLRKDARLGRIVRNMPEGSNLNRTEKDKWQFTGALSNAYLCNSPEQALEAGGLKDE